MNLIKHSHLVNLAVTWFFVIVVVFVTFVIDMWVQHRKDKFNDDRWNQK